MQRRGSELLKKKFVLQGEGPRAGKPLAGPLELFLVFLTSKTHPVFGGFGYGVHVGLLSILL